MIFRQWLEECLIPEMMPGSTVIIDNLPAHKVVGIRQCLEGVGMHLLYLPPYTLRCAFQRSCGSPEPWLAPPRLQATSKNAPFPSVANLIQ